MFVPENEYPDQIPEPGRNDQVGGLGDKDTGC